MVASKLSQILQLTPTNEITFQGPFDRVVTSYLELKNPSDNRVCFKVKTTAPKRYCVRPNSGIVDPDGKVKIAIMLQPMEPNEYDERNKHKFMVQSTVLNESGIVRMEEVWDNAKPEQIMDSKLRCVFALDATSSEPDGTPSNVDLLSSVTNKQATSNTVASDSVSANPTATTTASSFVTTTTTATTIPTSHQQEAWQQQQQQDLFRSGRTNILSSTTEPTTTSTPAPSSRVTSSASKSLGDRDARKSDVFERPGDKSVASSQNLTSSFLQPMNDDYKIVLVSLAMLFLGVILGKYII